MSKYGYVRCIYRDPNGKECDKWFLNDQRAQDNGTKMCSDHSGIISANAAVQAPQAKSAYIEYSQGQEKACYELFLNPENGQPLTDLTPGFELLDQHIANLEQQIEKLKTAAIVAHRVKRVKLDELTEEERAERRKIRVPKVVDGQVTRSKSQSKPSVKKDPIAYLMNQFGCDRAGAEKMLKEMQG